MTLEQLKMLKEVLALRHAEAKKQLKENEEKITEFIERTIAMDNVKVKRVSDNYDNWGVDVAVVDSEGKSIFGAECDLHFERGGEHSYHDRGLRINYGTCGDFNKNDHAQIDKVLMIAKIVQSIDGLEERFDALKTDKIEAFRDARSEVDYALREYRGECEKEIERGLAVNKEYKDNDGYTLKIEHITPKFVTYYSINGGNKKVRKSEFLHSQGWLLYEERTKELEQEQ